MPVRARCGAGTRRLHLTGVGTLWCHGAAGTGAQQQSWDSTGDELFWLHFLETGKALEVSGICSPAVTTVATTGCAWCRLSVQEDRTVLPLISHVRVSCPRDDAHARSRFVLTGRRNYSQGVMCICYAQMMSAMLMFGERIGVRRAGKLVDVVSVE